jgi:type II secretory pathway pseudopilin PulG
MKKNGFTLVELVVSAGVTSLVIIAISSILMDSFKARLRVQLGDRVQTNGNWAISELRRNVINSRQVSCEAGNPAIVHVLDEYGVGTSLICDALGQKIASVSASRTIDLTGADVLVSDCSAFSQCELSGSKVKALNFMFEITSGTGPEALVIKDFQSKVTIRE